MKRPSSRLFILLMLLVAATGGVLADAAYLRQARAAQLTTLRTLVADLGLTDLALFTEARYTRHRSQADLHAALQDHPLAFEHFPSGSLVPPPRHEALVRETTSPD